MSALAKLSREPALLIGVVASGLSLAVLFGVPLSKEQLAGIGVFVGAVMALTRYLTTPSSDVVARYDGEVIVAGKAAVEETGEALPAAMDEDGRAVVETRLPGTYSR